MLKFTLKQTGYTANRLKYAMDLLSILCIEESKDGSPNTNTI